MNATNIERTLAEFTPWIREFGARLKVLRSDDQRAITSVKECRAFVDHNGSYTVIENQDMLVPAGIDFTAMRRQLTAELHDLTTTYRHSLRVCFYMPNPRHAKYIPSLEMRADPSVLFTIGNYVTLSFEERPVLPEGIDIGDGRRAIETRGGSIIIGDAPALRKHDAGFYVGDDRKMAFSLERKNGGYLLASPVHFEYDILGDGHLTHFLERLNS